VVIQSQIKFQRDQMNLAPVLKCFMQILHFDDALQYRFLLLSIDVDRRLH